MDNYITHEWTVNGCTIRIEGKNPVAFEDRVGRVSYLRHFIDCTTCMERAEKLSGMRIDLAEYRDALITQAREMDENALYRMLYLSLAGDEMIGYLRECENLSYEMARMAVIAGVFEIKDYRENILEIMIISNMKRITNMMIDGLYRVNTPADLYVLCGRLQEFLVDTFMDWFGRKRLLMYLKEGTGKIELEE